MTFDRFKSVIGAAYFSALPLAVFTAPPWAQWAAAATGAIIAFALTSRQAIAEDAQTPPPTFYP